MQELQAKFVDQVERHRGILFKISRAYGRTREDREDLAQEILVQLWRSFGRFDERLRFSTWMYRVALNVAISFHRREATRTKHVVVTDAPLLDVAVETEWIPENVARAYEMIETLEPLDRALVLLHLDGFSHREIGEVLGISEANVATKLSRIRQRMRHSVSGEPR